MVTHRLRLAASLLAAMLFLANCEGKAAGDSAPALTMTEAARFDEPWAFAFLPGGNFALVTEKRGRLLLWEEGSGAREVAGAPPVDHGGQGGLADIVLSPRFAGNGEVYLSWVEAGPDSTRGAVVGRARFVPGDRPRLEGLEVIWRQHPKVNGRGHFSQRLAFSPDGQWLFIASGDRQKMAPAQDLGGDLGKIIRIALSDGRLEQVSLGHRNILGLKFDDQGQLWNIEHGPRGGDELNLIEPGRNYGWPIVSQGDHYSGTAIPRHGTRPEFAAPAISWNPVIAPGDFIFYRGGEFPEWRGQVLIAGLTSEAIVRVAIEGDKAREVERIPIGAPVRSIAQDKDGTLWLLTDGSPGKLLRVRAAAER